MEAPYSPSKYLDALETAVAAGFECIIIDSYSHLRQAILNAHSKMSGNSFTNWGVLTPKLQEVMDTLLQAPCHIIACMRTKVEYVLEENEKGRMAPRKVGTKAIAKEGSDYEFTTVFTLDHKHNFEVSKGRTELFD